MRETNCMQLQMYRYDGSIRNMLRVIEILCCMVYHTYAFEVACSVISGIMYYCLTVTSDAVPHSKLLVLCGEWTLCDN